MKLPEARLGPAVSIRTASILLALSLGAACQPDAARVRTSADPEPTMVASPDLLVEAHYSMRGLSSHGPVRGVVDVVSAGSSHIRLHTEIYDVDESLYVYDGRRLLVHDTRSVIPYVLYEAPGEHPEVFAALRPWRLDPAGTAFARLCKGAEAVARTAIIARRTAAGFRCSAPKRPRGQAGAIWLDRDTGVLLENDAVLARSVSTAPDVAATTFSTRPPQGVRVQVVAASHR
jgi:hypothetical protein